MMEVEPVVHTDSRVCTTICTRLFVLILASSSMATAQTRDPVASPDSTSAVKSAPVKGNAKGADQDAQLDSVYVEGKRWLFNRRTRYAHSLPEVDGPTITVTKKTSVVQLNDVPTIIDTTNANCSTGCRALSWPNSKIRRS